MSLGSENCAAPLSAADVAAVTGSNGNGGGWGGFGGDWLIAIVMLFLFPMVFGGGMWDGGMGGDGYSARSRDSRGRYSRDDGRSVMMEHLEMALDSATDQDREDIKRFMRKLENG